MLHFNKKKLLSSYLYFHISKKSKENNFGVLKILIGIFFIFINLKSDFAVATSTNTGTFNVSVGIGATCTASATTMSFGSYNVNSNSTGTSTLYINLTNGASFRVTMADPVVSGDQEGYYRLWLDGTESAAFNEYLVVYFLNPAGNKLRYSGADNAYNIVGTGNGANTAVATITGTIPSGQTGKKTGTFSRIISLNIAY